MAQAVSRLTVAVFFGFVVDSVAVGQVFLQILLFFFASIIPSVLHTHFPVCTLYVYQKDERAKPENVTFNRKVLSLTFLILTPMKRGHCLDSSEQ